MIEITKIRKNIMGTTSFEMKVKGWRKPQEFIVYPLPAGNESKTITIQSDKRFGRIELALGLMVLSRNHTNSCSVHLQMDIALDKAEHYDFNKKEQLAELTEFVIGTASERAGTKGTGIITDNSGAVSLMSL